MFRVKGRSLLHSGRNPSNRLACGLQGLQSFNRPTRRTRNIECKQDASCRSHQINTKCQQTLYNVRQLLPAATHKIQQVLRPVSSCVVQASLFLQPRILKPLMEKDSLVDHDKFRINLNTAHTRANSTQLKCGWMREQIQIQFSS